VHQAWLTASRDALTARGAKIPAAVKAGLALQGVKIDLAVLPPAELLDAEELGRQVCAVVLVVPCAVCA
jgi:hypothetical protein